MIHYTKDMIRYDRNGIPGCSYPCPKCGNKQIYPAKHCDVEFEYQDKDSKPIKLYVTIVCVYCLDCQCYEVIGTNPSLNCRVGHGKLTKLHVDRSISIEKFWES